MATLLAIMVLTVFSMCKRDIPVPITPDIDSLQGTDPDGEEPKGGEDEPGQNNGNNNQDIEFVLMGTGTGGDLTIDGHTRSFDCKARIRIKKGAYNSITIRNLKGEAGCPFIIENEGLIELNGDGKQMWLADLDYVTIAGDAADGVEHGFAFKNNRYRAVEIEGWINNFSLHHFSFHNIGDYAISYFNYENYNGSPDSYSANLSFTHITCRNTGPLFAGGGSISDGTLKGLVSGLEIAYVDFQDSPWVGSIVSMGNVEDYNIHHNLIKNINSENTNHAGIFMLEGNGKFHDNIVMNHQGNAIRAWAFSVGSSPKEVLIYNNIVYNSIKYSAFELQSFDHYIAPGISTYANAKVFNNTCGKMNTSRDWEGAVVDVYSLRGGKCQVFNNLAFDFPVADVIWTVQNDTGPTGSNNLYFNSAEAAGLVNTTDFKLKGGSKAKNAGIATSLVSEDIYGVSRGNPPSVGAVE